jgi:tRNA 2-thiouridine synthesizing protein A
MLCPIPVIRTQDAVRELAAGDVLEVVATDPGVLHDIPTWCRVHGHELLGTTEANNEIRIRLRVCAG